MSNRALTLATLGLLSGVAVTIATDGIIQPDGYTPAPPVSAYNNAGGDPNGSQIDKRHQDIMADDEEVFTLVKMILQSGALDG